MAVKDILLALTTYPEPTVISAVDEAIDFAAAVGARISAIACEIRYQVPRNLLANAYARCSCAGCCGGQEELK